MILPDFLTGPQFKDGDLVTFEFDDCDLTLRLPVIPNYSDRMDEVRPKRDFRKVDTSDWDHFGDDGRCMTAVATQEWLYECDATHDDIASCYMKIRFLRHGDDEIKSLGALNSETYKKYILKMIAKDMEDFERESDIPLEQPSAANNYFAKPVVKPMLDGLQVQLNLSDGSPVPAVVAFLPLGREFTLWVQWDFGSLHYRDRQNPYSEELLHKMKFELFDEFLSYIQIDYSPETLTTIERLTNAKELSAAYPG